MFTKMTDSDIIQRREDLKQVEFFVVFLRRNFSIEHRSRKSLWYSQRGRNKERTWCLESILQGQKFCKIECVAVHIRFIEDFHKNNCKRSVLFIKRYKSDQKTKILFERKENFAKFCSMWNIQCFIFVFFMFHVKKWRMKNITRAINISRQKI